MDFHYSFFIGKNKSRPIKLYQNKFHTAHARNIKGKKTVIMRDCLDGFLQFFFYWKEHVKTYQIILQTKIECI